MTSIFIKSVVFLSLGAAGMPALAQTEQPAQGQSAECPAGTTCPQASGESSQEPAGQGKSQEPSPDQPATDGGQPGAGQTQPKASDTQPGAGDKGATQQQGQSDDQPKGGNKQRRSEANQSEDQSSVSGQQGDNTKDGSNQSTGQGKSQSSDNNQAAGSSTTNVTIEQKTEITQVIREEKVRPVDVDFDVSVGVLVPKAKVELRPLPARIVKIVPRYEGYLFFVLADGRIVIVEPSSYKVVVVLA